jgi:hypothetical protein
MVEIRIRVELRQGLECQGVLLYCLSIWIMFVVCVYRW